MRTWDSASVPSFLLATLLDGLLPVSRVEGASLFSPRDLSHSFAAASWRFVSVREYLQRGRNSTVSDVFRSGLPRPVASSASPHRPVRSPPPPVRGGLALSRSPSGQALFGFLPLHRCSLIGACRRPSSYRLPSEENRGQASHFTPLHLSSPQDWTEFGSASPIVLQTLPTVE